MNTYFRYSIYKLKGIDSKTTSQIFSVQKVITKATPVVGGSYLDIQNRNAQASSREKEEQHSTPITHCRHYNNVGSSSVTYLLTLREPVLTYLLTLRAPVFRAPVSPPRPPRSHHMWSLIQHPHTPRSSSPERKRSPRHCHPHCHCRRRSPVFFVLFPKWVSWRVKWVSALGG